MARVRPVRTPWGVGHIQKAGAAWAKALRRLNYVFSLSGRRSPLACRIQPPRRRPIRKAQPAEPCVRDVELCG